MAVQRALMRVVNPVQDLYQVIDILMEYGNTIYAPFQKILYGHSIGPILPPDTFYKTIIKSKDLILTGAAMGHQKTFLKIVDHALLALVYQNITFSQWT